MGTATVHSIQKDTNFHMNLTFNVVEIITALLPQQHFDVNVQASTGHTGLMDLSMADPAFNKPAEVELLLGVWARMLLGEINTQIGWIMLGEVDQQMVFVFHKNENITHSLIQSNRELNDTLGKFWEAESVPTKPPLTKEEQWCEANFKATMTRAPDGKFIVTIPDPATAPLGESKRPALQRFFQVE